MFIFFTTSNFDDHHHHHPGRNALDRSDGSVVLFPGRHHRLRVGRRQCTRAGCRAGAVYADFPGEGTCKLSRLSSTRENQTTVRGCRYGIEIIKQKIFEKAL